ncbi:MAG: hypothetical protein AAGF12_25555 [Myxococcota bacterium]
MKTQWIKGLVALLVLLFGLGADDTGCRSEASSDVNQQRIYTSYWLLYDGQTDITYARAQFRLGSSTGTTLVLQDPARVEFEGTPMGFNEVVDWHEAQLAGEVASGEFRYTDTDGSTFVNRVALSSTAEAASDLATTIPTTAAFELAWEGPPLGENETMVAFVARVDNRFNFGRFEQRSRGATSLVIGANGLRSVGPGAAVLSFRRHRDLSIGETPMAGGHGLTTYQSREVAVTLR